MSLLKSILVTSWAPREPRAPHIRGPRTDRGGIGPAQPQPPRRMTWGPCCKSGPARAASRQGCPLQARIWTQTQRAARRARLRQAWGHPGPQGLGREQLATEQNAFTAELFRMPQERLYVAILSSVRSLPATSGGKLHESGAAEPKTWLGGQRTPQSGPASERVRHHKGLACADSCNPGLAIT